MKKYSKPTITVNRFETTDVISTSCTCPENCYHFNYYHDDMAEMINKWQLNEYRIVGVCPEHGNIFERKPF